MFPLPSLTLDERPNLLGARGWEQTALELAWGLLCQDLPAAVLPAHSPALGQAGWALRGLRPVVHRIEAWREIDVDGFSEGWHLFLHADTLAAFLRTAQPAQNSVLGHLHHPKHTFAAWMMHLARAVVHQATGKNLTSQGHPPTPVASGIALTTEQWALVAHAAPETWLLEGKDWPRHPRLQQQAHNARLHDWHALLGEPPAEDEQALARWWRWNHAQRKGNAPASPVWMAPWASSLRTLQGTEPLQDWMRSAKRRLAWMYHQSNGWLDAEARDGLMDLVLAERDEEMMLALLETGAQVRPNALFDIKQPHLIAPMLQAGARIDATNADGTVVQWAARTAPETVSTLLNLDAPLGEEGMKGLIQRLCVRPDASFEQWKEPMLAVYQRRAMFEEELWWIQSQPLVWLLEISLLDLDVVNKAVWFKSLGMEWPENIDPCSLMKNWLTAIHTYQGTPQQTRLAEALGRRLANLSERTGFKLAKVNEYGQNVLHIVFAFCRRPSVLSALTHSLVSAGVDLMQEDQGGHTPYAQPVVSDLILNSIHEPLAQWISHARSRRFDQQWHSIAEEVPPTRKRF